MITVAFFTILACVELVTDQLPSTPARTKPAGLVPRILLGALCGATVASAGGQPLALGAVLGAVGGVVGAFAGYEVRTRLVKALGVPDFVIAVLEDAVAVGSGLFLLALLDGAVTSVEPPFLWLRDEGAPARDLEHPTPSN